MQKFFFRFRTRTEDDIPVIPFDTPIKYRLWIPHLLAAYRYHRLERALDKYPDDEANDEIGSANSLYQEARFYCIYGRAGKDKLRKFVDQAVARGLASKKELRCLIEYGDLAIDPHDNIILKQSKLPIVLGVSFLALMVVSILFITTILISAEGHLTEKLFLFLMFTSFFAGCGYLISNITLRPYILAKRLKTPLQNLNQELSRKIGARHLYLVK